MDKQAVYNQYRDYARRAGDFVIYNNLSGVFVPFGRPFLQNSIEGGVISLLAVARKLKEIVTELQEEGYTMGIIEENILVFNKDGIIEL